MPSLLDISTSGSSELPIYTITFTNPPDHRLTHALMAEVGEALNRIERDWRAKRAGGRKVGGAVILRGQGEKFFSNGLIWEEAVADSTFLTHVIGPLIARLLSFPLITISAINGHAFAGGMLVALATDYRVMRKEQEGRRIWCCMNEVDFGAVIAAPLMSLLRDRIPLGLLPDTLVGKRLVPSELLQHGVVSSLASSDADLMDAATALATRWGPKAAEGAWGINKEEMYRSTILALRDDRRPRTPAEDDSAARRRLGMARL